MSRRIVRKQSLLSKVKSYPFDFLLYINEIRLSIDWDEYTMTLALPLGALLTVISLVIKVVTNYYESINSKSSNMLFSSDYYQYERLKSSLARKVERTSYTDEVPITTSILWLLNSIVSLVMVVCLLNTYLVFSLTRNYGLLYCRNKPNSSSVVRSSIEPIPFYETVLIYIGLFFVGNDADETDASFEEKLDTEIWQLNVWDPSKFSMYVMVWLNPINSLLIHNLTSTSTSLLFIILICALVSLTFFVLVGKFYTLINDKQILYQEMFTEYNNKFVKPKTTILKKDVLIDSTQGPYDSVVLTDMAPYAFNKTKLFVTHDLKGDAVHEYGQQTQYADSDHENNTYQQYFDNDHYLDRIQSDNEDLMVRNQILNQKLSQLTGKVKHEIDQYGRRVLNEDDTDRSWYTSSTPYKQKNPNRGSTSNHNELYGSPILRNRTPSFSTTPSNYPRRPSSMISRSPSPSKFLGRSPSLHSDRSFSQRSPSPVRSPSRSPMRRGPDPQANRSANSLHYLGKSPSLHSERSPTYRNTSPTRGIDESLHSDRSPTHRNTSPSREADRSPSSPMRGGYEGSFARPSSIYNPLAVTPSTNLRNNQNTTLRSPSPTMNPLYTIRSPSPGRNPPPSPRLGRHI